MSTLSVVDFGAKGDGTTDNTAAMQAACAKAHIGDTVNVPAGTFMVNATAMGGNGGAFALWSGTTLCLSAGAVLKAFPTKARRYCIVLLDSVTNVTVTGGGTICGERDEHIADGLPETSQWGYGINSSNSSNVNISGITIKKCWGDGITILGGSGISVDHVVIDGCYRQNMSLCFGDNIKITNNLFQNVGMTNLDLEPFAAGQVISNVLIQYNKFVNCGTLYPVGTKKVHLGLGSEPNMGVFKNIRAIDNQFDIKQQPIWAHDTAGTTGIPAWAAALNVTLYQGLKADWYRFWGYPTSWSRA